MKAKVAVLSSIVLMVVLASLPAEAKKSVDPPSLTPEHFASTALVKDDPLDTHATITTINGYQDKRGLLKIVWNDNFLRAIIDKKTGKAALQLYQVIDYTQSGWNFYESANFETPDGPQSKPVVSINRDVDCYRGGCSYTEHVGLDLDESLLRQLAAKYTAGQPSVWNFKFNAKSGQEYRASLQLAEIVGFLAAVDSYRASHPVK